MNISRKNSIGFTVRNLRTHRRFCRAVGCAVAFFTVAMSSAPAFAATAVLGGSASLDQATGATLSQNTDALAQFTSSSASAVLDWSKFNIGSGQEMNFNGAGTTFFNLVNATAGKSQIDGMISGNGSVWVINPNGIAFGANSTVNVGGLFAAAAGNIENADALRNGTATMPSFSSFEGAVSSSSTSKFTANQVAMLGKTVTAKSDYSSVGNLTFGAAGEMVVDEVAGGKVSVNLAEFVEKSDTELELGSLLIDGDLRAVTDGKVKVNGVIEAGSVYLKSGGEMIAEKNITADTGNLQLITQDGDILIDKDSKLTAHGDGATLQVQAGQNALALDEDYNIVYPAGDITIDGELLSDGDGGVISVFGGYNGFGDVNINGKIESSGNIRILTENGDISVSEKAGIKTVGDDSSISVYTGLTSGYLGGDINVSGNIEATGKNAVIDIEAAWNYYTDGSVDVSGSVSASGEAGSVFISSGNGYCSTPGNTRVSGSVEADSVTLIAYDKDVVVGNGATVKAGASATLVGVQGVKSQGTIDAKDGVVVLNGDSGDVSATGVVKGSVSANGSSVRIESMTGFSVDTVTAKSGNATLLSYIGGIDVKGSVKAGQAVALGTGDGDVKIHAGAEVFANGGDGVVVSAGQFGNGDGNIVVDGNVTSLGDVSLHAGAGEGAEGAVLVNNRVMASGKVSAIGSKQNGEAVNIKGVFQGTGDVYLQSMNGDVVVDEGGMVASIGEGTKVNLVSAIDAGAKGNVCIKGSVYAIADSSEAGPSRGVSVISGYGAESSGDVVVPGSVQSDGIVELKAGHGNDSSGAIDVSGRIVGNEGVDVSSEGGDIDIATSAVVGSSGGNVSVVAGQEVRIDGFVSSQSGSTALFAYGGNLELGENSTVKASDGMVIAALGSVYGKGSIDAGTSKLQMEGANGSLIVSGSKGVVKAGDADFSAMNNVLITNPENDFTGLVTARGNTVEIHDWNDLTLGDIVAKGGYYNIDGEVKQLGVIACAGKNLTVAEGANVVTEGDGAGITLASHAGELVVCGAAVAKGMGSAISLTAGGIPDVQHADVTVEAGGRVAALGECSVVEISGGVAEDSTGDVIINGSVSSCGTLRAYTGKDGGDIRVDGKMEVEGKNSSLVLAAGFGDNESDSNITVTGALSAKGENTGIALVTDMSPDTKGVMDISGDITAEGNGAVVLMNAAYSAGSEGDISISGNIDVRGDNAKAWAWAGYGDGAKGNVYLREGGFISAEGTGNSVILHAGSGKGAQGFVKVDGRVEMVGSESDLEIVSGLGEDSVGDVSVSGILNVTGDDSIVEVWSGVGDRAIGNVNILKSANIIQSGENAMLQILAAYGEKSNGGTTIGGKVRLEGAGAQARIYGGYGTDSVGFVDIEHSGAVSAENGVLASTGYGTRSHGEINISGTVESFGQDGVFSAIAASGDGARGDISVSGTAKGMKEAQLRTGNGNILIDGDVSSSGDALVLATGKDYGNIHFGAEGSVNAAQVVNVVSEGDVTHDSPVIQAQNGYVNPVAVKPAISGQTVVFGVDGNVGSGDSYLGVDGKMYGVIGGSAAIASAGNIKGGDSANAPKSQVIADIEQTITLRDKDNMVKEDKVIINGIDKDFSALGGTSSLVAKGNLSVYAGKEIEANGLLKAGGDLTVSAAKFGDVSYLHAGGKLTVNNVGKPGSPQISYFESVNGVEPRINNMPNDTVIFVDGRLAGGNTQIINTFGANEAFMVQTPELKSTQGIFGNPTFMHSDLDVANPLEVSAIDYMIQDIPRLTLSSDFPAEVDRNVEANGLSARDSIWFGQEKANAKNDESEEKSPEDDKPENDKAQVANTLASIR